MEEKMKGGKKKRRDDEREGEREGLDGKARDRVDWQASR
jgi:hypothetical protein